MVAYFKFLLSRPIRAYAAAKQLIQSVIQLAYITHCTWCLQGFEMPTSFPNFEIFQHLKYLILLKKKKIGQPNWHLQSNIFAVNITKFSSLSAPLPACDVFSNPPFKDFWVLPCIQYRYCYQLVVWYRTLPTEGLHPVSRPSCQSKLFCSLVYIYALDKKALKK